MKKVLLIVSILVLTGCAGTAFDKKAKQLSDPEIRTEFCNERKKVGVVLETAGFISDILLPKLFQSVSALTRNDENLLDNPTTVELNKRCEEDDYE